MAWNRDQDGRHTHTLVRGPHEDQAAHLPQMCRGLGSCSLVGDPGFEPHGPRSVDSGSSYGILNPSDLLTHIPDSSTKLLKLHLMFGCGSLRLLLSAAG